MSKFQNEWQCFTKRARSNRDSVIDCLQVNPTACHCNRNKRSPELPGDLRIVANTDSNSKSKVEAITCTILVLFCVMSFALAHFARRSLQHNR